jgi:hypothetical protein
MKLAAALPDLVASLEGPLAHLGRGDLIGQLQEAEMRGWTYDDFADTCTLQLSAEEPAELLSLWDDAGVNLEMDAHGRLCRIEVLEGEALAAQLGKMSGQ